jgi:hypothetical protein
MPSPLPANIARKKGLRLVVLGSIIFALFVFMPTSDNTTMNDFGAHYFPARTLVHHADPYNANQVLLEYLAQRSADHDGPLMRDTAIHYPYPPTLFLFTSAFAIMPFSIAKVLWAATSVGAMILASFLVWDVGSQYAPRLSGALIALLLVNSETIAVSGTISALAISLCAIAVWCFVRQRAWAVGVICLGLSLVMKPQEGGFIWLYFLLAGQVFRKRALQTLLLVAALGLPSVLWVTRVAPDWPRELTDRIVAVDSARGSVTDPGPTSLSNPGWNVNLQVITSRLRNDPRFYDPATYLICGSLIAIWAYTTLRSGSSADTWVALATIAALSLLVVYHRRYDTKLLLLAVPACTKLWAERGRIGRVDLGITGIAILFTGDGLWISISRLLEHLPSNQATLLHFLQTALIVLPAPLSLVTMSVFYLWVYLKRVPARTANMSETNVVSTV